MRRGEMREYKFRGYDYDRECMYRDSEIVFSDGTVFIGRKNFIQEISDDVELMQYTGLKDKNGVEIYEGDVVRIDNEIRIIVFEEGAFGAKNTKSGAMLNSYFWEQVIKFGFEVIGNIYQNPELLESTK
jgi:uncharacterized phage protein (TIGR01671 family)